jgi:hypothetical protein
MKTLKHLLIIACLFITSTSFSQDKKPAPYSLGIGYGLNFGSSVFGLSISNSIQLSCWMPKNVEIILPISYRYSGGSSTTYDSIDVFTNIGNIKMELARNNVSKYLTIGISPGALYHFKTKNNLDVYLGGAFSVNIDKTLKNYSLDKTEYPNYFSSIKTTYKYKSIPYFGIDIIGGVNYFFYQNLALGARFNINNNFNKSKTYSSQEIINVNNGSINLNNDNSTTTKISNRNTSSNFSSTFAPSGSLTLTYYFNLKKS